MFSDAGLNWASMLLIAQSSGRDDRDAVASIIRNSFSLAACSAALVVLIVGCVYWLLNSPVSFSFLPRHSEFPGLMLAIGASVVCNLALSPFYNLLIGLQEAHIAGIYQGAGRLLGTLGAVVVAFFGASLGWVFSANVAGALIVGLIAALHCRRRHAWAFLPGSWWEPIQIRQQLRTGAKSLTMQVGNVMWGTAPVMAISSMAGAQFVPYFSIPMTLLSAPFGILQSFSANLQAGYGEAFGRGEFEWVAVTVHRMLRQVVTAIALIGCGFLLLASLFVRIWTAGKIELEPLMLINVLVVGVAGTVMSVYRFAITGVNRHKLAGVSDFFCGILALLTSFFAVRYLGFEWVWIGVLFSVLLTNAWVLPRELRRALHSCRIAPPAVFWVRWAFVTVSTLAVGLCLMHFMAGLPGWFLLLLTAFCMAIAFFLLAVRFMRSDLELILTRIPQLRRKRKDVSS